MQYKKNLSISIFFISLGLNSISYAANSVFNSEDFDCLIEPNKRIEVASPIEGIVNKVMVTRGSHVTKGQLLFQLNNDEEKAALTLAKARAEYSTRAVKRNEQIEDKSLISDQERDEVETDKRLADAELESAEVRLAMRSIKSPIEGIVVERYKHEGEYVETDAVLALVSIDPLYVEVVSPLSYLGKIKLGSKAVITPEIPAGPKASYQARVSLVDPVVDAASGTFRVRLVLPNPKAALPSGLKCRIAF